LGNLTVVGASEDGLDAIEFDCFVPEPVPEPVVLVPAFTG
jgi:hypothetical protein